MSKILFPGSDFFLEARSSKLAASIVDHSPVFKAAAMNTVVMMLNM